MSERVSSARDDLAAAGAGPPSPSRARIQAKTLRTDRWWLPPLTTFLVLMGFVVYGTWRAFENRYYFSAQEHLLAPFYSPCLSTHCAPGSSDFGQPVGGWWMLSPALIILIFPLGFRLSCYYYRKAYYRSFWLSPPACAVGEPHRKYSGETRFPLVFQNVHRYFFYASMAVATILAYDAIRSFRSADEWGHMGLGSLILVVNAALIWAYTLSCHSCRHIVGGRLKNFSRNPLRYWAWTKVSTLNSRHMLLAWLSMFSVVIADFYVRLVASGTFADPRFF